MTLGEHYEQFYFDKSIQGLSKSTLQDYYYCLLPFLNFVGNSLEVCKLDYKMIQKYMLSLQCQGFAQGTISSYVRSMKIFLRWVSHEEPLTLDISRIKVPRCPKKIIHLYTDDEILQIFQSVNTGIEWLDARNRSIIALMLDSGLRQSEPCTIHIKDIDFKKGTFKVTGKGSKERIVPLGNLANAFIKQYIDLCPYSITDYLFLLNDGNKMTGNAIKLFVQRMKKYLDFEFSCHKLRHNFATNYCVNQLDKKGTVDIYSLMIIMGHENISTTQKYEHFAHEIIASRNAYSHLDGVWNAFGLDYGKL